MTATKVTKDENLAERIETRKKFLGSMVPFLVKMVLEHGIRTSHDVSSDHAAQDHELTLFEASHGFKFETYSGGMGSATLTITYKGKRVFHIYWQGLFELDECKVEEFDQASDWKHELQILIGEFDEVLWHLNLAKERMHDESQKAYEARMQYEGLQKEAVRLKVI